MILNSQDSNFLHPFPIEIHLQVASQFSNKTHTYSQEITETNDSNQMITGEFSLVEIDENDLLDLRLGLEYTTGLTVYSNGDTTESMPDNF